MGFDKFAWLKALVADPTVTDREFRLAALLCISKSRRDGTGWRVKLDNLAAEMPEGMDRDRMNLAFRKMIQRGYLHEVERSVGGRGVRAYRWFNLSKPTAVAPWVSEKPKAVAPETHGSSAVNPRQEHPSNHALSCDDDPLKVLLEGTLRRDSAAAPIPEEPPQKTCTQHPDWNGPPCVRCQSDKRAYNQWLDDSRRLLSDLDREADTTRRHEAADIRNERRRRIAVFHHLKETWK